MIQFMKTIACYEVVKIEHERGEMCLIRSLERKSSHVKIPSNDPIVSYKGFDVPKFIQKKVLSRAKHNPYTPVSHQTKESSLFWSLTDSEKAPRWMSSWDAKESFHPNKMPPEAPLDGRTSHRLSLPPPIFLKEVGDRDSTLVSNIIRKSTLEVLTRFLSSLLLAWLPNPWIF